MKNLPSISDITPSQRKTDDTYLRLKLDNETQVVVPMKQAKEALLISSEKITVIPNMPTWVVGLLNQRSRIFWVIDLPSLLQLSPSCYNRPEYPIAIMQVDQISLGLIVQEIQGIVRFSEEMIESPVGKVSSGIVPYLKGCILQPEIGILLVLDPQAILNNAVAT